jgi:hypothetical protein
MRANSKTARNPRNRRRGAETKGGITHANVPGLRLALVPSLWGRFKVAKITIFENGVKK